MQERGYSLVELDTELWSDEPTPSASRHGSQDGEITELTKESWEVSFFFFGFKCCEACEGCDYDFLAWFRVQLIKAPYVKLYSIIKTQTMSADGGDEVISDTKHVHATLYTDLPY